MKIHLLNNSLPSNEVKSICGIDFTKWRGRVSPDWEMTNKEFLNREKYFRCKRCESKTNN